MTLPDNPMPMPDDHALMKRVAAADQAAYRMLVRRHLSMCVRFAERMLGSRHDAEDIAQEVCLKIWHEAPRWQPKAKFSTWLYRVMYNACIDHRRKVVPFANVELELIADNAQGAEEAAMQKQRTRAVQAALQKLPPRQRAALVLSYYEGVPNEEAAETMGIAVGAFQQLLFRARATLKQTLVPTEQKNG